MPVDRSIVRAISSPVRMLSGGRTWPGVVIGALFLLVLAGSAKLSGEAVPGLAVAEDGEADTQRVVLAELARRADRALGGWEDVEEYYHRHVRPLERVLLRYRNDPELVSRIALSLYSESRRVDIDARLLLAVLLVENPWLDPKARSPVGAVGLMQVMPFHRGKWGNCAPDLEDVEANICHGARIFAHYFRQTGGDIERALLRYNGCVRGTNTPDCHRYPYHVFARAGRASILAWLDPPPTRAASP
jgi:soluble lytic murein transglycosylase-like protein